jgi:hypothetical protein
MRLVQVNIKEKFYLNYLDICAFSYSTDKLAECYPSAKDMC